MTPSPIDNKQTGEIPLVQTKMETILLPKGLIGFQDYQSFSLCHYGDDIYSMLTSNEEAETRFLLCNLPWDFYPTKDLVDALIAENLDEIDEEIYAIVCCSKDVPTLNLRAPLVRQDEKMWQIVLNSNYPLDYALD